MAKIVKYFDGERFLPLAFFKGEAATIRIGEITTGEPGTDIIVENVGDEHDAVLNITIPRGRDGIGIPESVGVSNSVFCLDEQGIGVWEDVATAEDAVVSLATCGVVTPVYQDGIIYTDADGAIYTV